MSNHKEDHHRPLPQFQEKTKLGWVGLRMAPISFIIFALPCTVGAIVLPAFHIYRHLLNYTEPTYQRYILRIVLMVPVSQGEEKAGNHERGLLEALSGVYGRYPIKVLEALKSFEEPVTGHEEEAREGERRENDMVQAGSPCLLSTPPITSLKRSAPAVYALTSFLSLVLNESSIYFNSIREVYEAWVIYNFLSLCLAWVGGPGSVVLNLSGRVLKPSCCLMTCCFPPIPLDGRFIRRCKQGCLQFVILKPILVAVTFILYAKGKYKDGNFSVRQAYLYVTIIYTVSYTMALYALALFYVACRDLLRPFNPVPKFILIKSVVFLTYWQGVLVFLAAKSGFIKNAEEAAEFQNFVICIEMLIAAVGHFYAFPYKEYAGANVGTSSGLTGSLAHAIKFNDFYHDTVHQFAPTYHEYVLYNHNESDEGTRKYRSRTFVPTGQEMDTLRRNPNLMVGNKIEDTQLGDISSSDTSILNIQQDSSSLIDTTTSTATSSQMPFDLSLIDMDLSGYPAKVSSATEEPRSTR
ncbi:hypothetical protein GIB67_029266 [Kingdonia uniflora]|uniref:Transmembrane protein 184A n=1 Tax=Kingdonia uniflora TaxID=39325 RepID=A0A7J7N8E9_9MAGN|nr:hypothetical protein GIB67_029266 [Kingdonia uniflora]